MKIQEKGHGNRTRPSRMMAKSGHDPTWNYQPLDAKEDESNGEKHVHICVSMCLVTGQSIAG